MAESYDEIFTIKISFEMFFHEKLVSSVGQVVILVHVGNLIFSADVSGGGNIR